MRTQVAAICFLVYLASAQALSWSVCDDLKAEYTTDSSRLTGNWPFYNLLYTCSGNITIEGYQVDACVNNGQSCGQAAADALCQYLGFDQNSPSYYSTVTGSAPALSLTGEWCLSPGKYANLGHPNRTQFESISSANQGPYCSVLSSVTCIRSRSTLAASVPSIVSRAAQAPATAPNTQLTPGNAFMVANPSPVALAGRKMKGFTSICNDGGCAY